MAGLFFYFLGSALMYAALISVFSVQQARKLLDETKMKIKDKVQQENQSTLVVW